MEIKQLRCFAHVAETLNFNRAADRLNMSQPVVTKTVAQLEHKLGVKLFERTTRRVSLTPAGVVLRREVEGLLAHLDKVQRAVRHEIGADSGRFAIGVTPLAMQTVFPQVIRGFREAYPEIDVTIREFTTEAQVKALLAAEIDVGFLLAPATAAELEVKVIHEEVMRLAIPSDHPHLRQLNDSSIPLSAFAGDTFIIPPRSQNPGVHDEIIRACAVSGFRPRVQECHENQSCLSLVEAGIGVSFVMNQIDCVARGDVHIVDLEAPAPVLSIALAWRSDDPLPFLEKIRSLAFGMDLTAEA
ncbi:LysR family transcriptional regulator [Methyloligella sp. 2.7D]|uniref:LysR family transcriptional regulator n=1 Tax=unclassified Methyloligella TaxID=2625955 RepID=UPI00157D5419|nr:LysR family transcriptional regulator [Methyloligella sp. GL2]QKP76625.1 LysR family transcriptional regulator [Methyloligella sp. GL2]